MDSNDEDNLKGSCNAIESLQSECMTDGHGGPSTNEELTLSNLGNFIAAGVLPYSIDEAGNVKFFVGKELAKGPSVSGKNKYSWSDFGGKRENEDETPQETACREFSEETLGLWGGMGELKQRVQRSAQTLQVRMDRACSISSPLPGGFQGPQQEELSRVFVLKNGLYINFVLRVPYIDPLLFQLARDENDSQLAGELPDSDICRAAEKRDWAWVDSKLLLSCVEGGVCRVLDQDGKRLHLLPRLAVALRSHLRLILSHINCMGACDACARLLLVPVQQECRCLHLFDVRAAVTSGDIKTAFGEEGMIEKVTIYRDRNRNSNAFVLFSNGAAAVTAKARALSHEMDTSLWEGELSNGGAERAQYAWFEYGGGEGPIQPKGTVGAKRKVARWKKLGVGLPTAPWAKKKCLPSAGGEET